MYKIKIEAENVCEDISNYTQDSEYYSNANNLVVSNMEDEACSYISFFRIKILNVYKNILFNMSYVRHKISKIPCKEHNTGSHRIIFLQ